MVNLQELNLLKVKAVCNRYRREYEAENPTGNASLLSGVVLNVSGVFYGTGVYTLMIDWSHSSIYNRIQDSLEYIKMLEDGRRRLKEIVSG